MTSLTPLQVLLLPCSLPSPRDVFKSGILASILDWVPDPGYRQITNNYWLLSSFRENNADEAGLKKRIDHVVGMNVMCSSMEHAAAHTAYYCTDACSRNIVD